MIYIYSKTTGKFVISNNPIADQVDVFKSFYSPIEYYIHEEDLDVPNKYIYDADMPGLMVRDDYERVIKWGGDVENEEDWITAMSEQLTYKAKKLYEEEIANLTSQYSQTEIDSWDQQKSEAEAYVADNTTPTPLLSAMATARGITVELLATNIITNVNNYRTLYGAALGKKQGFEDQIKTIIENGSLTTIQKIEALDTIVVA